MECQYDPEQGVCFSTTCLQPCARNFRDSEHSDVPTLTLPTSQRKPESLQSEEDLAGQVLVLASIPS